MGLDVYFKRDESPYIRAVTVPLKHLNIFLSGQVGNKLSYHAINLGSILATVKNIYDNMHVHKKQYQVIVIREYTFTRWEELF